MKPYPRSSLDLKKRIFNDRLSRARRFVENVFGICATRFRILHRPILSNVDTVVAITKAIVCLHNYLMADKTFAGKTYFPDTFVDQEVNFKLVKGEWRKEHISTGMQSIHNTGSHNFSREAKDLRDDFKEHFNSDFGSVPWQMGMVTRTE